MRWDPYIKNSEVSAEKWELINKVLDLLDPPKVLRATIRQQLKNCSEDGLRSKIVRMSAGGSYFVDTSPKRKEC